MKHLNYFIAFLAFFIFTMEMQAQGKRNKDKINLLKISFITEQLELTSEEAQQFWPIYNKYNDKIHEARIELERGLQKDIKNKGGVDDLTEEQSEEILARYVELETIISTNRMGLVKDLRTVISAKKIVKLQIAEREFNRRMLQEYGRRRRMNQN